MTDRTRELFDRHKGTAVRVAVQAGGVMVGFWLFDLVWRRVQVRRLFEEAEGAA